MSILASEFRPMKNKVFVTDMEAGARLTRGGIILPNDDMKNHGIRSRWAKVWAVGEGVDDLIPGEWVLIKHGRWSFGIELENTDGSTFKIWHVDYPDSCEVVSTEDPRLQIL